ncbi:MAG: class I SAM-dependent methyltransferase [Spirochaetaceae bacterium]|nr:class I SAM-dependent methyltransferase [Spirochaetaceae bacterium]
MKFYKRAALLFPPIKRIYQDILNLRQRIEILEGCNNAQLGSMNADIHAAYSKYQNYKVDKIDYGKVEDYCDSMDNIRCLTDIHKDLKDVQRPWIFKAILSLLPVGSKLLEIGAGEPLIANMLSKLGYDVYVIDPYDGTGNGPVEYENFVQRYPDVKIIRKYFTTNMSEFKENEFDCIFSVSVLEHISNEDFPVFFDAVKKYLKQDGYTIHAIDHIQRGLGDEESRKKMKLICSEIHLDEKELESVLKKSDEDTETFYLSAYGFNLWRRGVLYKDFPMRRFISVNLCSKMN